MNNTLYIFARDGELTGYTSDHQTIFRMTMRETDTYVLSDLLIMAIEQTGYKPDQCTLVTRDIVKIYFARKIGMHVITPHEWLEILNASIQQDSAA